ncbi:hypothetical protein LOTGIDRAFT_128880 [Lottia gigantea]|uniref:M-phase inducer phosphatase n=1 Tax=Lottia gigantea TaxID=225164 RepID=V3ZQH9_LOTGI|nr:hypothetical protein LOTGIDRAFT_128880 [Lottia gigantea]ESO86597.1 hypothetical protein LOTGIDRAFT_128880 [Lottia gigantea]
MQRPRKLIHDFKKDDKIDEEINIGREDERIKSAVERLSDDVELIADCSRPYSLPTVCGKHKDLKSISPKVMADLLNGKYPTVGNSYMILDCRYPYEYDGGHIQEALNFFVKESIDNLLKREANEKPKILIFHCEFSSQRAPNLLRYLRSQDRLLNSDNYPSLYYPEVYILDGGYKAFYEQTQGLCYPATYTPMLHEDHASELRHFRVKSKSWTAGEKPKQSFTNRPRPIRF